MRKKILMLVSNEYRPDPRVHKEASTLSDLDYDITILAWDRNRNKEQIEAYQDGPTVKRIRTFAINNKKKLVFALPFFYMKVVWNGVKSRPDIVHAHDLDTIIPGIYISKILNIPLIYDAHEHYSQMVSVDVGVELMSLIDIVESKLVKNADIVIAANDSIANYIKGIFCGEVSVVMNCIDPPDLTRENVIGGPTLFYGGSLEPGRYIEEIIAVTEKNPDLSLRIAGDGRLKEQVEEAVKRCDRITFLGYLDHKNLLKEMARSTAIIAMLDPDNPNNRIGTPNRLFEAMALGVPVFASEGTLGGDIVKVTGAGIVINWSEGSLLRAVQDISANENREKVGDMGIEAFNKKYNWGQMSERLVAANKNIHK